MVPRFLETLHNVHLFECYEDEEWMKQREKRLSEEHFARQLSLAHLRLGFQDFKRGQFTFSTSHIFSSYPLGVQYRVNGTRGIKVGWVVIIFGNNWVLATNFSVYAVVSAWLCLEVLCVVWKVSSFLKISHIKFQVCKMHVTSKTKTVLFYADSGLKMTEYTFLGRNGN